MIFVSLGVSICLDMVSIETLDLDTFKSWSRPSRKSRQVLKTSLDALKSRFLSRSRRQKKVSLDRRENLDGFQKLVSTRRTFSISISIGLDVETTRLSHFCYFYFLRSLMQFKCCESNYAKDVTRNRLHFEVRT